MNTRIGKLLSYLETVIKSIDTNSKGINADWLSKDIHNYSLDKIPTRSIIEEDVVGNITCKDIYSFRSRNAFTSDKAVNLNNIGFFEQFEDIINSNNEEGILPDIENIISIECLNCGTVQVANTNTCIMDIQIQIEYEK